jgi:D-aminopeptidase
MKYVFLIALTQLCIITIAQERKTAEAWGIRIGVMQKGASNSITDVPDVKVGQVTLIAGDSIRTGVTAILPHGDNLFQEKVPAAVFTGNGFGKLAGVTQIQELGTIESPIVLTNTMNVAEGINGIIRYTITQKGNENVQSVNAVVGETNDGELNDIRGKHITVEHVLTAINTATTQKPQQGNVGAGTGTICFGYKGGIGTASRKLPASLGGYTLGVLVQTNFGGVLQIAGVPVGEALNNYSFYEELSKKADGSCMMVVATDAPLDSRNLERLAKRAFMGLAKTGGIASNGSGDYVIAFSSNAAVRMAHKSNTATITTTVLKNDAMSPLFMAAIEATEEAIINALFMAADMKGKNGKSIKALPMDKVTPLLKKYHRIGE